MERLDRFWVGAATTLLLVAIAGAAVFLYRYHDNGPPVFIAPPVATGTTSGEVSIGGAVANPGLYPLRQNDTIAALLEDAGGATEDADRGYLKLYIPRDGEMATPQRVDLNHAEAWLLEALPGIGPKKATAIVEYRKDYGPFRLIEDLLRVPGIGEDTLQDIRQYITIAD